MAHGADSARNLTHKTSYNKIGMFSLLNKKKKAEMGCSDSKNAPKTKPSAKRQESSRRRAKKEEEEEEEEDAGRGYGAAMTMTGGTLTKKGALAALKARGDDLDAAEHKLKTQIHKDWFSARRFLKLKKRDLALVALKKHAHHEKIHERLVICKDGLAAATNQLHQGNVVDALSRKLAAVDDICEEIKLDLAEDYLANMRRPNFNLFELHTKLQKLGITDETVLKHLNAMWVEVLEETLMEGETAAANPGRAPMDRTQTEIAYAEVGEE
eukprot:GHVU01005852.1.p1 GENE.GHVU01005852.1~~GHVU01005852.1.p1  ORF type:complete len:269 (+),score=61.58 GHVU01005852.1:122-928(+)